MKFRVVVGYEYPVEHKPPVRAELILHGDRVVTDNIELLEQEPKTGYWYRQTNDYVDFYECSECGMATGIYDVKNYCPNCGSRNEVEE